MKAQTKIVIANMGLNPKKRRLLKKLAAMHQNSMTVLEDVIGEVPSHSKERQELLGVCHELEPAFVGRLVRGAKGCKTRFQFDSECPPGEVLAAVDMPLPVHIETPGTLTVSTITELGEFVFRAPLEADQPQIVKAVQELVRQFHYMKNLEFSGDPSRAR